MSVVVPNREGVDGIAYNVVSIDATRDSFRFHVASRECFEAGVPGAGTDPPDEPRPCSICVPPAYNVICVPSRWICSQT